MKGRISLVLTIETKTSSWEVPGELLVKNSDSLSDITDAVQRMSAELFRIAELSMTESLTITVENPPP